MKQLFLFITMLLFSNVTYSQIYIANNCNISFFSSSPLEDIEAVNKIAKPIINTSTGDVQIKILMNGFIFDKPLMQEHFNENYVESEKYPNCVFKGKINEPIDWVKDGEYKVTVTGILSLHGVDKERKLDGTITVKGTEISIATKFNIHIADHNIKVPSLYVKNIAEDVEVKLNATLEPYKKK
ncbi:MAG: YceI family protein [Bacteroidia bacterium]